MDQLAQQHTKVDGTGALFIQNLTTIDSAIFDPALGVVGQSWHIDIELRGSLDQNGFVYDFSAAKKLVRQMLKESIDHALILPVSSKGVDFIDHTHGEQWRLRANCRISNTDNVWEYSCPKGATYPIRCVAIRKDLIEQEITKLLKHRLPPTISDLKINLRDEAAEVTTAFFRYTHGITHHDGLCQRLFHGHRSRLEISIADERRPDLEHYIARDYLGGDVHIATPSQFASGLIEPGMRGKPGEFVELIYQGNSGEFKAKIPADRVLVVEQETSIESIARQLMRIVKREEKTSLPVKVMAFEGIGKGGICIG